MELRATLVCRTSPSLKTLLSVLNTYHFLSKSLDAELLRVMSFSGGGVVVGSYDYGRLMSVRVGRLH